MIAFSNLFGRGSVLSFFLVFPFPRLSFEDDNYDWASILLTLIVSSVLGVIVPNFLHGEPRTHNGVKLINDCFGRVQLAFVSFYLTLLITVQFKTPAQQRLMGTFLLASFIFFFVAVRVTSRQQKKIQLIHGKKCTPGRGECTLPLDAKAKRGILAENVTLSIISSIFALYLAFSPAVVKRSQSNHLPRLQPFPPQTMSK